MSPNSVNTSVIVTVYKRKKYLHAALQSVLNQSLQPREVIVADDSNSNEISLIVEGFNSPLITYIPNSSRQGVAPSVRNSINAANSELIAIMNDDDEWMPDFLAQLTSAFQLHPACCLAFCDHWLMDERGSILLEETEENTALYGRHILLEGIQSNLPQLVLLNNAVPLAMGSIFSKTAFDSMLIVDEVKGAYDFWISCLLAESHRPAVYVKNRLTRYRIHPEMETARDYIGKYSHLIYIYRQLLGFDCFKPWRSLVRKRLLRYCLMSFKHRLTRSLMAGGYW
jgi:glycosyltransferase involved in cell wall biosynthesis